MRRTFFALVTGLGVAALAACTTTITQFEDDGGAGSGASGGNGTGGNGSGGNGSGGNGTQCNGFEDTTQQTDVAVTIRNTTADPIYLTGLDCEPDIDLRLYAGDELISFRPGVCHFTCEELQETEAICAAGCAAPMIIMIAPGGSYEMGWDGTVHDSVEMPTACYFTPEYATPSCDQRIVAPSGAYAFEVTGYDDSWCPLDQPGACECTPDASGSCMVEQYGDIISGQGVPARAALSFPSDDSVEVVFD